MVSVQGIQGIQGIQSMDVGAGRLWVGAEIEDNEYTQLTEPNTQPTKNPI